VSILISLLLKTVWLDSKQAFYALRWFERSTFSNSGNSNCSTLGLLNYFKKGSSYKCQKFLRSSHSHEIMQMGHDLDFSNKKAYENL